MQTILTRRSIRSYTAEPIPDEVIQEILKAGMSAPSAGNQQPWHFVVITERKMLNAITKFHPHAEMCKIAPLAVVVCGDLALETHKEMWVQDCSAASENILLAAHSRKLGAVWVGLYPRKERIEGMRKLLNLPEPVIPLSLIPIGHPAEKKPAEDRYLESRVHYNGW